MKIERTEVFGFRAALRGMRSSKESWDRSDSWFRCGSTVDLQIGLRDVYSQIGSATTHNQRTSSDIPAAVANLKVDQSCAVEDPLLGPEDLKLALKLIKGGSEHRKFLRQIMVWVDLTLPRYVWTEFDTYKVSTVRNSGSTMHKLGYRDLSKEDDFQDGDVSEETLRWLNDAGRRYRGKLQWDGLDGISLLRHIKARLPEGFLQKATCTLNYETLLNMYRQRQNHRLPEWSGPGGICAWIKSLPCMNEFLAARESKTTREEEDSVP